MRHAAVARRFCLQMLGPIVTTIVILGLPRFANAQDSFEIRVEQYEQPVFGSFSLEEHLNYAGRGTSSFDGTVAPTNHQFHMSSELTAGLAEHVSVGLMLMTAVVPGTRGLQYAGWRVLPHFFVPESWHLPIKAGLTAEFSFQRAAFDENTTTLELRPILERSIGRVQIDLNPSIERGISRSNLGEEGWSFEPSLRIAYEAGPHLSPCLEYFGAGGPLGNLLPVERQVHQLYPGVDWKLKDGIQWDFGIGVGLTPMGNRLIYKTRVEFSFGRKASD
jgi:hypothetical protein